MATNPYDQFDQQSQQASNPYDQFTQQAPAQPQTAAPIVDNKPSSFIDGVEAFNRQFGRMSEGVLQIIGKVSGWHDLEARVKAVHDANEASYQQAAARSPIATTVGNVLGAVGSGVAYGGPAIGAGAGLGTKVISGALGTAAQGAAQYADTEQERAMRAGIGGAVGGIIPLAGKAVSALLPETTTSSTLSKVLTPEAAAAQDIAYLAKKGGAEGLDQTLANADNLGVSLTPGQALGNKALLAKEANLATDDITKGKILEAVGQQEKAGVGAITKTINDIAPEGTKQLRDQLYGQMKDVAVGNDVMDVIKNNPSLSSRLEDLNNAKDSLIKNLPDNSLVKVDALKRELDDTLWRDTFQMVDPSKKLKAYEVDAIKNARGELMNSLSNYSGYTEARDLAQKSIIQNRYTTLLDKAPGTDKGVRDYYKVLFSTPEKQQFFLNDIAQTGGDVEATKGLIDVLGKLKDSPLAKSLGHAPEGATSGLGSKQGMIEKVLNNTLFSRYKDQMLNLMLDSGKWAPKIQEIVGQGTLGKQAQTLVDVLKGMPSTIKQGLVQEVPKGAQRAVGNAAAGYLGNLNNKNQ